MSKTKTTTSTPSPDMPEWIRSPASVGFTDVTALSLDGLYKAVHGLNLPLPEPVVHAVQSYARIQSWRTAPLDLAAVQAHHRAELIEAAKTGAERPSPELLSTAALRAGVLKVITTTVDEAELHLYRDLNTTIRRHLDAIIETLAAEHDRVLAVLKTQAERLPVSVRDAQAALDHGLGEEWTTATEASVRIGQLRDARRRAARADNIRGRGELFAMYWNPDALIPGQLAENVTVGGLSLAVDAEGAVPWCPSRSELLDRIESVKEERRYKRLGVSKPAPKANVPLPGKVATA